MTSTQDAPKKLAEHFYGAFEQSERSDGVKFYCLKDGSPRWMQDAIREAHDELMPDDWVYEQCYRVAAKMTECNPDQWEDSVGEWADSLVDVYNADRAR